MIGPLRQLLDAPSWLVCLVVGVIVFAEDALFVGFLLPGETVAVLGGVAARLGHVPLTAVLAVVVTAAVLGDVVGYEVGRRFGPRLLRWRVLARHGERLTAAQAVLARRGGPAVFLGRWTAFLRAVTPALAGMAGMPYRRFLAFNAMGGLLWGVVVVLLGYAAGTSYEHLQHVLGRSIGVLVVVVAAVAVTVWWVRVRRVVGRSRSAT